MKVITLLNEKGGVGKTTLAVHIAAGLAMRGYRVLLADADAQGHATIACGHPNTPGLYDLLVREEAFSNVLKPVSPSIYAPAGTDVKGQLWLLPSNVETRMIPMAISDTYVVRERLHELSDAIDVVIFDTAPTPSLLHGSIYMATDGIIYPTKCEFFSFDGLTKSLAHRSMAQKQRSQDGLQPIKVIGIVPTMYRSSTAAHVAALADLQEQFKDAVWPVMPLRTAWVEASMMRQTVYAFAGGNGAVADAWSMVDRTEGALNSWLEKQIS